MPDDQSYAEAAQKMVAGATAVQIGAKYIADFYNALLSQGVPDELARDLTKEFSKEVVSPKIHENSAGII